MNKLFRFNRNIEQINYQNDLLKYTDQKEKELYFDLTDSDDQVKFSNHLKATNILRPQEGLDFLFYKFKNYYSGLPTWIKVTIKHQYVVNIRVPKEFADWLTKKLEK